MTGQKVVADRSIRQKAVEWSTDVEPFMRWPDRSLRWDDHLRLPYREFLRLEFKGLLYVGPILGILVVLLAFVLRGLLPGHWLLIVVVCALIFCGVLAIPIVQEHVSRRRALQGRQTYKVRVSGRGIRIGNSVFLFKRMTRVSIEQEPGVQEKTCIVFDWDGARVFVDVPASVPVESARRLVPERLPPAKH